MFYMYIYMCVGAYVHVTEKYQLLTKAITQFTFFFYLQIFKMLLAALLN